jgi:hypothetical protein
MKTDQEMTRLAMCQWMNSGKICFNEINSAAGSDSSRDGKCPLSIVGGDYGRRRLSTLLRATQGDRKNEH